MKELCNVHTHIEMASSDNDEILALCIQHSELEKSHKFYELSEESAQQNISLKQKPNIIVLKKTKSKKKPRKLHDKTDWHFQLPNSHTQIVFQKKLEK